MGNNIKSCIRDSSKWLLSIQNADGGWGETENSNSSSLNTSESIIALLSTKTLETNDKHIFDASQYLKNEQQKNDNNVMPEHYGVWYRNKIVSGSVKHFPDCIRTAYAIIALSKAGINYLDKSIKLGIAWLVNNRNDDGGWGYTSNMDSEIFPTCLALSAIKNAYTGGDKNLAIYIEKGLECIVSSQFRNSDGSFGKQTNLIPAHTLYALDILQKCSDNFTAKKSHFDEIIINATKWIEKNTNLFLNWLTEEIILNTDDKYQCNYPFSHITPAIYLKYRGESLIKEDLLAQSCLQKIYDTLDENTNGFSTKRPVSWATAKTLIGLDQANVLEVFPPKEHIKSAKIEPQQWLFVTILMTIFFTSCLITVSGSQLSNNLLQVIIFITLSLLLFYGKITEKTFIESVFSKFHYKWK